MRILRGLEPAVEACQHLLIDEIMAARLCAQPRIARLQPFLPRLFMTAHPDHFTRNMMIRAKAQHLRSGIGVPVAMIEHDRHIQMLQLQDEPQKVFLDARLHVALMCRSMAVVFQLQQQLITKKVQQKAKEEAEAEAANRPIEVDVVRREKKQRPHKKA